MMKAGRGRLHDYAPLIVLFALVLAIGLYDRSFFSSDNLLTIVSDTMTLFLMASGVTFVIRSAGSTCPFRASPRCRAAFSPSVCRTWVSWPCRSRF